MGCVATIDPGWVQQRHVVIEMWNKRIKKNSIRKCGDCPNMARDFKQPYCTIAFTKWAAGKSNKQPYVNKNRNCMFGYKCEEVQNEKDIV